MAKSTPSVASRASRSQRLSATLRRYTSPRLLTQPALGLVFFTLAFWLLYPLLIVRGNLSRLGLAIGAVVVLVLAMMLVVEFINKQNRLKAESVRSVSVTTGVNTVLGLGLPALVMALVSNSLMRILGSFPNYETIFCELRRHLIVFYYHNAVYYHLLNLFMLTVLISLLLVTFGSVWEKNKK